MWDSTIFGDCGNSFCPPVVAQLHGQAAFLQTLQDAVGLAGILVLIIENDRIVHVSTRQIARQLGYSAAEAAAGIPFSDIIHPDDRDRVAGHHLRLQPAEDDVLSQYDCSLVTKNGERREYEVSVATIPGTDPMRVIAVCKDISERKHLERGLVASEHLFRGLTENSPDYIILCDRDLRVRYLNQRLVEWVSISSAEELIGKRRNEVWPDGRFDAIDRACEQVMETGNPLFLELTAGECVHSIYVAPEKDVLGSIIGTLIFGRDVTELLKAEKESRRLFRAINQSGDAFFLVEDSGRIVLVNDAACRSLGYSREEFRTMTVADIEAEYSLAGVQEVIASLEPNSPICFESYHRARDHRVFPVEVTVSLVEDGDERTCIAIARDISARKRTLAELEEQRSQYRALADNSPDTVVRYDRNCRRIYVNPAATRTFDAMPEDMLWRTPSEFPGWKFAGLLERNLRSVLSSGKSLEFEMEWADGGCISVWADVRLIPEFDKSGQVESVLGIFRDISELREYRLKLEQSAFHDDLTGLPNRALLMDRLHQTIADAAYHERKACVMMLDLDRFKIVNDSLGHAAGDHLLREVARRLGDCVRPYDTVARLGGDEFVILMPDVRDGTDLARIGDKIRQALDQPFRLYGRELSVTSSLGIALFPDDGDPGKPVDENAADLLKYADTAMYQAKRAGRNGFAFYSTGLTESATRALDIEIGLRHALIRNELEVHYQPKVSFGTEEVIGSEALLRWRSADLGMIPPDQFIPVAEDTGLILEIGEWVLRQACIAAREWNLDDCCVHKVAVNFSTRQFHDSDVVRIIADVLAETGCRAEWLEVEITETLLLDQGGRIAKVLAALRDMGITIAIDDFGTGYSSLSYLADFPIDTLKIDKSFIREITTDPRRAELVRAILSIAECLGQKVVAEGVETYEQVVALKDFKCHIAQGWYYGRPLPKGEMPPLIIAPAR